MKKIPNWIVILFIITLLIVSKFLFFGKKEDKQAAAKGKNAAPLAVNFYVVQKEQVSNDVFSTGRIGAFNQVDIIPEVSGKVVKIFFQEGAAVRKGDLLLKLNDRDLQAQLLKIQTQLKLSEQKLARLKKLIEINGISQEELDIQDNEIMGLKADQAYVQAQLDKTNITAPFDGEIGLKNVSEGAFVNQTVPVVSLVQTHPVYVEFSVPEKYSAQLRKGLRVNFSSENVTGSDSYSASVYALEPRVDETTKTIRARARYEGRESFYPGAFVKVFVDPGRISDALMVPTAAVIPTLKGQKVFVSRNGVANEVMVTIGVRTDEKIQIVEGLAPGDTVITTGLLSVKKDSKLRLINAAK